MSKRGIITFDQKDEKSLFMYSFEIDSFHAAQILEYISRIPNAKNAPLRDSKGRFYKPMLKKLAKQVKL